MTPRNRSMLAIDTSGPLTVLGLKNAVGAVFELHGEVVQSHNEELRQSVAKLLKQGAVSPQDLGAIVLGTGPGSFTGLRIGYSFVQGLAFANRIPVYEISTARAMAWTFRDRADLIVTLVDARRDEFFAHFFKGGMLFESLGELAIMNFSEIAPQLELLVEQQQISKDRVLLLHHQGETLPQVFKCWTQASVSGFGAAMLELGAAEISGLGQNQGFDLTRLAQLSPQYVRAVAARKISERASG